MTISKILLALTASLTISFSVSALERAVIWASPKRVTVGGLGAFLVPMASTGHSLVWNLNTGS